MSILVDNLLQNINQDVRDGSLDREKAIDVAQNALQDLTQHPIDCAFIFGSSISNNFKPYSDIDIVVFVDGDNHWHKLMRIYDGYLLDIRVFDIKTLNALEVTARHSGHKFGIDGIVQGICIFDENNLAAYIQERFRKIFNNGPDKIPDKLLDSLRAKITHSLVELCTLDENEHVNIYVTGLNMFEDLGFFLLISNQLWFGKGKWAIRYLKYKAPDLVSEYLSAFKDLANNNRQPLCLFTLKILEKYGGAIWESTLSHPAPLIKNSDNN